MKLSNYTSSIRKIGLVNSGMFDELTLNFDVKAIHLVGANNVGKTSLISLIQFLYFPFLNEMTFIKSPAESLGFYFRPEGSYILFEVRTITGNVRTVGIFGTGGTDSRVNFVFNGGFETRDFMDPDNIPLHIDRLQTDFFARDFERFEKFEKYEDALLGLHTSGNYNVPMFELSKTNFRLLRKLMQGLLKLDRIDARDVQRFLIKIVEKGTIKTKFNLLQDFEQKYRHISRLRIELRELDALKPIMALYQKLCEQIARSQDSRRQHQQRLFHLSSVYLKQLEVHQTATARQYNRLEDELERLGRQISAQSKKEARAESRRTALTDQKNVFIELDAIAKQHTEAIVKQKRDTLTYAMVDLDKALADHKPERAAALQRQRKTLQRELDSVRRQLRDQTLETLWVQAGFDEEHRALLKFLVAKALSSLKSADVLADRDAFVAASAAVRDQVDADGRFIGFGLDIPRAVWFIAEKDQEPLGDRKERLKKEIAKVDAAIEVAQNFAHKQKERDRLQAAIARQDRLLTQLAKWQALVAEWESVANLEATLAKQTAELERLRRSVAAKTEQNRTVRQQQHRVHADLKAAEARLREIGRKHADLKSFDGAPPENLAGLGTDALREEYQQVRQQLGDIEKDLKRLETDLIEPRNELEARYEKNAGDIGFDQWLASKANLANEVEGLEDQLQREYNGIFTVVRAKLSKITQAFRNVQEQVAALNKAIRHVKISNIDRIKIDIEKTALLDAIEHSSPTQLDLFAVNTRPDSLEEAHAKVEDYFAQIKKHGNEINLKDMFRLKFAVFFNQQDKPVIRYDIHRFESNGTETGVKIVIYLGLIGLLQERKNVVGTRIPFFLDEVGSLDSENLKQLIAYCEANNFLPIFASPNIREDISHNYLLLRDGKRSRKVSEVKIGEKPKQAVPHEDPPVAANPE